jgi:hypothetical protein
MLRTGLGGGPPGGAGVFAEADGVGDGVGGVVDGDNLRGVNAAEGDLLPSDHDYAGVAHPSPREFVTGVTQPSRSAACPSSSITWSGRIAAVAHP